MTDKNRISLGGIDWKAVVTFIVLMLLGWMNIYAAIYTDTANEGFRLTERYGMQLIWIGAVAIVGTIILLADDIYYHIFAYPFYWIMLLVLVATIFLGRDIKGARSWLELGPISMQPAEFMKIAVALALARYMSNYNFSLHNIKDIIMIGLILGVPVITIILQHDTGSAIVYGSFLFMLYREGLNKWIYYTLFMVIALFITSFLFTPLVLLVFIMVICLLGQAGANRNWRDCAVYSASVILISWIAYMLLDWVIDLKVALYPILLIVIILSVIPISIYAYRNKLKNIFAYMALAIGSIVFVATTDYIFNDVLEIHQQKRILDTLGIESDLQGWGYNVNQSKIAIGSGGLFGKGFLEGTQTQYDFVPEQSTDFIFCTVGEEWGLVGSTIVLLLFCYLIMRIIAMGERQEEPFRRVYCYGVAGIFLLHVGINIAMTVGLMPVIGIPLPMFSYGGSSLMAFAILFFIAVRLDAKNSEIDFK